MITIASFYLDGVVLAWYQWMYRNHQIVSWSRQHKCGARVFLMVANHDDDVFPWTGDIENEENLLDPGGSPDDASNAIQPAQLSLHALSGTHAADTFRVMGLVGFQAVQILVDGGSTHNFIQQSMAIHLGLAQTSISPFPLLVGSGQELLCSKVCHGVPLSIQGHLFNVDLYTLGLCGADIVLGAQWLKQLGPVLMNYSLLTMTFFHQNTCVELHGDSPTPSVGLHSFQKLARNEPTA